MDDETTTTTITNSVFKKEIFRRKLLMMYEWKKARFKAFIEKNVLLLGVIVGWFAFGAVMFAHYGFSIRQIPSLMFYLAPPLPYTVAELGTGLLALSDKRLFWNLYYSYGPNIIIPATLSIIIYNMLEGFHPDIGCRRLAKAMQNHTVILGYNKFGERIVNLLKSRGEPFVVVDPDPAAVDELVRRKEPVVIDDIDEIHSLKTSNINKANVVIVAEDDPKLAVLATKRVRELNPKCMLIVRCFADELVEVIESLGANIVISSWKKDADDVMKFIYHSKRIEGVKQLTVITKDRVGVLTEITELFGKAGINIDSISEEDFMGEAIIQMLTNDVDRARKLLLSKGFNVTESDVLIVTLNDKPGELAKLMKKLSDANIDVESLYLLSRDSSQTTLAIKVDKPREAKLILKEKL